MTDPHLGQILAQSIDPPGAVRRGDDARTLRADCSERLADAYVDFVAATPAVADAYIEAHAKWLNELRNAVKTYEEPGGHDDRCYPTLSPETARAVIQLAWIYGTREDTAGWDSTWELLRQFRNCWEMFLLTGPTLREPSDEDSRFDALAYLAIRVALVPNRGHGGQADVLESIAALQPWGFPFSEPRRFGFGDVACSTGKIRAWFEEMSEAGVVALLDLFWETFVSAAPSGGKAPEFHPRDYRPDDPQGFWPRRPKGLPEPWKPAPIPCPGPYSALPCGADPAKGRWRALALAEAEEAMLSFHKVYATSPDRFELKYVMPIGNVIFRLVEESKMSVAGGSLAPFPLDSAYPADEEALIGAALFCVTSSDRVRSGACGMVHHTRRLLCAVLHLIEVFRDTADHFQEPPSLVYLACKFGGAWPAQENEYLVRAIAWLTFDGYDLRPWIPKIFDRAIEEAAKIQGLGPHVSELRRLYDAKQARETEEAKQAKRAKGAKS